MPLGGALKRSGRARLRLLRAERGDQPRPRAVPRRRRRFVLLESRAFVVGLLVARRREGHAALVGRPVGVNALAVLRGAIDVTIDGAGRITTQSEQRLLTRFAPIVGARWRPARRPTSALVVRAPSRSDYDITVTNDLGDALPLTLPLIRSPAPRSTIR
jgi:hypothetical protein